MALFQKATKRQAKLRMALIGPAGSGKTYSALNIAKHLGRHESESVRIAVIDTEHGSASKYADIFDFDTVTPTDFSPQTYTEMIRAADAAGYDVLVIDSLSHAWIGRGGALELVDAVARKQMGGRGNAFSAWRDVTPLHNELVDTILGARLHIIATMRAKMAYEQEQRFDQRTNQMKTVVTKLGLQPIQREGVEYEFDVVGDLNLENVLTISKTRCPQLKGAEIPLPGKQLADTLRGWLEAGAPAKEDDENTAISRLSESLDASNYVSHAFSVSDVHTSSQTNAAKVASSSSTTTAQTAAPQSSTLREVGAMNQPPARDADPNHHLREEIRAKLPLAQKTEQGLNGYLTKKYGANDLDDLNAAQLKEVLQVINNKVAELKQDGASKASA